MSDFINKIITVILVFLMLVLSPLLLSYMQNELVSQRMVLNEVTQFLDKVTDKGSVTENDIDDLYLGVNSYGMVLDVSVQRLIRTASQNATGTIQTNYYAAEDMTVTNSGDIIKVDIKEVGMSPARWLTYAVLKIDKGGFKFTLAEAVR